MALPKQVQKQLDEVEELEKQLSARQDQSEDDTSSDETEQTETEEPEPVTETEEGSEPAKDKPADTSPTDVAADFEQKYNTLRGKYDAEVPRLYEQVRDLTSKVSELQTQLAEAKKKPEEPTEPKEKVSLVTDADREEFGEELIDVQRRVAREVAAEYEQKLQAQAEVIEDLRGKVDQTGSQVGEMNFAQRLTALVPDFPQIDNDERWAAWLNEYDPMLRGPRRIQAKAAYEAGDAEAVAHYVQLFKESLQEQAKPTEQPHRSELEKQVTPSRSASNASKQDKGSSAKVYSEKEMNRGWAKIRNLNTQGKYDEAAQLEAELTAAYMEGRVRA